MTTSKELSLARKNLAASLGDNAKMLVKFTIINILRNIRKCICLYVIYNFV